MTVRKNALSDQKQFTVTGKRECRKPVIRYPSFTSASLKIKYRFYSIKRCIQLEEGCIYSRIFGKNSAVYTIQQTNLKIQSQQKSETLEQIYLFRSNDIHKLMSVILQWENNVILK